MSLETEESDRTDPMSKEDQVSGLLYYINSPEATKLKLENLKSKIENKEIANDISDTIDSDVDVPEAFKNSDGKVIQRMTISDTKVIESSNGKLLFCDISLDKERNVNYRGDEILTMDVYQANAVILRHDESHYLAILAKRDVADEIVKKLRAELGEFGSSLNDILLSSQALERIQDELDAELINSIISDLPYEDLSKVELNGYGFEDTSLYEDQQKRGNVENHLLNTENLVRGEEITLRVSDDGLVRIRNKVEFETFTRFLRDHVLPYAGYKLEYSPSLEAYSGPDQPVFVEIDR
jgi:hypothetical protein